MFKIIHLTGEDFELQVERHSDIEAVVLRFNDFVLDEKESKEDDPVYKENQVLEVYPSVQEIKEIIKALQGVLTEADYLE
ncbi:hypothetical protein HPT25_23670 [Bacillus sp. BRMEA1]|uniref:hypothetical protein n=1 Tax=Neobacillus endophyticus TaxID=2738405 RepID=UPI00156591E0|nr:hypothetical protein [Neobacillus endophyticus]NRD80325.1 hypothetical protein [Neobacillus endophyticus]